MAAALIVKYKSGALVESKPLWQYDSNANIMFENGPEQSTCSFWVDGSANALRVEKVDGSFAIPNSLITGNKPIHCVLDETSSSGTVATSLGRMGIVIPIRTRPVPNDWSLPADQHIIEAGSVLEAAKAMKALAEQYANSASESASSAEASAASAGDSAVSAAASAEAAESTVASIEGKVDAAIGRADTAAQQARQAATSVTDITGQVSANAKRIANLEAAASGVLYREDTDATDSNPKAVPAGAMPYASVNKIGGRTYGWNQLVPLKSFTNTQSDSNAGNVRLQVSAVDGSLFVPLNENPITSAGNKGALFALPKNSTRFVLKHNGKSVDLTAFSLSIERPAGTVFFTSVDVVSYDASAVGGYKLDNIMLFDLTAMFGAGNEPATVEEFRAMFPADYYPYSEPVLLDAKVDRVVGTGKNLLDVLSMEYGYLLNDGNRGASVSGAYRLSGKIDVSGAENITLSYSNCNWASVVFFDAGGAYVTGSAWYQSSAGKKVTRAVPSTAASVIVSAGDDDGFDKVSDLQLERGTTATAYSPYRQPSIIPVPAAILSDDMPESYGWVAGSVSNTVDASNVLHEKVDRADAGSLTWTKASGSSVNVYYANLSSVMAAKPVGKESNVAVDGFKAINSGYVSNIADMTIMQGSNGHVYVGYANASTPEQFKTAMSGKYIYFEKATETTVQVPPSTRCPMYGAGIGDAYNYVDFERREYVQRIGEVDPSTLRFQNGTDGRFFTASLLGLIRPQDGNELAAVMLVGYEPRKYAGAWYDKSVYVNSVGSMWITDKAFDGNLDALIAALAGKKLYYVLAEPIVHDLSDIISPDNLLGVESGGTVRFDTVHGEGYRMQVPTEVEYVIDVKEAVHA